VAERPTFTGTSLDSPITKIGLPLIAIRDGEEAHLQGSARLIASWLAITASHVIAGYSRHFDGKEAGPGYSERSYELLTYLPANDGQAVLPLFVGPVWYNDGTDIAVLQLVPGGPISPEHVWAIPTLELLPPKEGSHVAAFGYPRSSVLMKAPSDFEVHTDASIAYGTVMRVHHERRDLGFLKFPCFEANASFDGGMSGGPVLDEVGHVCGIVSTGLPEPTEEGHYYSHGSTLWPLMATMVNFPWDARYPRGTYFSMYDFAKAGMIHTHHLDHISVTVNPDGTQTASCRRYNV